MKEFEAYALFEFARNLYEILTKVQQHDCSRMNNQGKGGAKQYTGLKEGYLMAFHWMKKLADMGDSKAMLKLGIMYCRGNGVEKDTEQGDRWFDKVIRGNAQFANEIAILYHTSEDMQNFVLAHKWYKHLDENGGKLAQECATLGFGLLYEYGDGIEQDYHKALEYYTKLVDSNSVFGIHRLALMHYYGKGVDVDYQKSFDLFKKDSGFAMYSSQQPFVYNPNTLTGNDSQDVLVYCVMDEIKINAENNYYLGLQYKYGQGVSYDQDKAQYHFTEALSRGCKRAKCELDEPYFK